MRKKLILVAWIVFASLGIMECSLRFVARRNGHVQTLLGKPWYYLVPFDVPSEMPSTTPEPGKYRWYDPKLGWTTGNGGADPPLYFSDADGVRSSKADHDANVHGLLSADDIITIGDSFTHGDEVAFEDTWSHLLAEQLHRHVVNLGVGGYGIDQAALRYDVLGLHGKVVLLGFVAGDLERALTPVYNFTRAGLKSKPMFVFGGSEPRIANQPAAAGEALANEFRLGAKSPLFQLDHDFDPRLFDRSFLDHLYIARLVRSFSVWKAARKPPVYLTPGPDFDFCMNIVDYLDKITHERGATLVVVLLDNGVSMADRKGNPDPWKLVRDRLAQSKIKVIDATEPIWAQFRVSPASVINPAGVHYTPAANKAVAETITKKLTELGL